MQAVVFPDPVTMRDPSGLNAAEGGVPDAGGVAHDVRWKLDSRNGSGNASL